MNSIIFVIYSFVMPIGSVDDGEICSRKEKPRPSLNPLGLDGFSYTALSLSEWVI
jgi:hypothetical protein